MECDEERDEEILLASQEVRCEEKAESALKVWTVWRDAILVRPWELTFG